MIQNYCENRYDPLLYSVVFAMVLYNMGIPLFNQTRLGTPGSVFTEYALALLEHETPEANLTKLQGILLLGAHLTFIGRCNKGIPLLAMAWKMIFELRIPEQDSEHFDIKLDPIERELRNNIWWVMRLGLTWTYFHVRSRMDRDLAINKVKLPVKNESESVLFALDKRNGYNAYLQESAAAIRRFYNCAYLVGILSDIWINITPKAGFCSLYYLDKNEAAGEDPIPIQNYMPKLRSKLHDWMNSIPSDLAPLNAAEILLCLNILNIHSYFPKMETSLLVFLEESSATECITAADTIVNLSELVLGIPNSLELHSMVAFGLNTSARIHILIAGSGTGVQRKNALRYLRRTLDLLEANQLAYRDEQFVGTLRDIVSVTEISELPITQSREESSQQSIMPVVIPHISLDSIANVENLKSQKQISLLAMLVQSSEFQSSEASSSETPFLSFMPSPTQFLDNDLYASVNQSSFAFSEDSDYSTSTTFTPDVPSLFKFSPNIDSTLDSNSGIVDDTGYDYNFRNYYKEAIGDGMSTQRFINTYIESSRDPVESPVPDTCYPEKRLPKRSV
ncbi:uncharacterized protein VTP21DRAFT_1492 [Calcarisporiella thermophila]|uniref:uncharacterized protein n=1 Tax=Calcarisporiella thermophila TaxID=911321 RepID=UPI0037420A4F